MMISTQHLLPGPDGPPPLPYADQKGGASFIIPSLRCSSENSIVENPASDAALASGASSNVIVEGSVSGSIDVPMEIVDVDLEENKSAAQQGSPSKPARQSSSDPGLASPGGFGIDVCFEASKLPLDVAIFNSARASGGDEKIRKYLQAVLVIGGTARISGMAHALESRYVFLTCTLQRFYSFDRLQAIATPLVVAMEKVQIIPPPKDVDPRVLAWKGGAVLGKMDGVAELWVTQQDWVKIHLFHKWTYPNKNFRTFSV